MDITTRTMAFLFIFMFLVGTAIGSILPEFGNVLAVAISYPGHCFNPLFLVIGIAGIVLAFYLGYRRCR